MRISENTLLDSFEFKAFVWIPENPNDRQTGIVRVRAGEITLELMGSFRGDESPRLFMDGALSPEIILGVSDEEKLFTLYQCHEYFHRLFEIAPSSKFRATRLYYGSHFDRAQDIIFTEMTVECTYLSEWLAVAPIDIKGVFTPGQVRSFEYGAPKTIFSVALPCATLDFVIGVDGKMEAFKGVTLRHRAMVVIKPTEGQSRRWYEVTSRDLSALLTLLIGEPVYATRMTGWNPSPEYAIETNIFSALFRPSIKPDIHPSEMPVAYDDVSDLAPALFQKWFEYADKLRPVYDLLCGTYYNAGSYEQSKFLALMQAVETLHRRMDDARYWDQEEYRNWLSGVMEHLPPLMPSALKERLQRYLQYGNEYGLRKRLKLMLKSLDSLAQVIAPDADDFIGLIYRTRNYLTHYEEQDGPILRSTLDFHEANRRLTKILKLVLFQQFGIDLKLPGAKFAKL